MKRTFALLSGLLCLCMLFHSSGHGEEIFSDRIVAVVNGDIILESDITKQKQPLMRNLMNVPLGVIPPGKWPTEKEILDELVVIHLLEQEAARKGIKIDDKGVDASIESIKKRNNLAPDQFIMFLAQNGLTVPEYKKIIRRQFLLTRLINSEVLQKTPLSEDDAMLYFKEHRDTLDEDYKKLVKSMAPPTPQQEAKMPDIPTHEDLYIGGKLRLRQLTLKIPANAKSRDVEQVMTKAKQIYKDAMTGADFAKLAKKYSQDSNASSGGDLGLMDYKDMVPNFQKLVQRLKEGDITPPLKTPQAVLIFYLEDAKHRSVKKIPIPEKVRKNIEKQWKQAYEEKMKEAEAKKKHEEERAEAPSEAEPLEKLKSSTVKLTPEEEKEYLKSRKRIIEMLRHEKLQARMKDWIEGLKRNANIEMKI